MESSAKLRMYARQALKGNWQTALLISFCAGIIGIVVTIVQLIIKTYIPLGPDIFALYSQGQWQFGSYLIMQLFFSALELILSSVLAIGLVNYFLQLLRGREARISLLFSRFHIWGKCMGQSIMISLFSLGWFIVVFAPLAIVIFITGGSYIDVMLLFALGLFCLLAFILLRYAMAPYLLAEHPDMGVMDSIRESKGMMSGQAGRLFKLGLSFWGWLLLYIPVELGLQQISPVVGTFGGLCFGLVLNVYIDAAWAAFYMNLSKAKKLAGAIRSKEQE